MKKETKSPITDNLLRTPGQSLDEEIDSVFNDKVIPYLLLSAMAFIVSVQEWLHFYSDYPPNPILYSILTFLTFFLTAYKIIQARKQLKNLRQGRDGEKAVAELLNFYREAKMKVFHDVIGDNFNIDHVVVSTRGIFLVETKTYSKPLKGKAEIIFNGKHLIKNNLPIGDSIMIQVTAGRTWLVNLIEELTVKKCNVQPVVVFPGWYVKMTNEFNSNIWVLNPKNLHEFINKKPEILSSEDVKLISNHLARYIKNKKTV
jgi:hypothetical protein